MEHYMCQRRELWRRGRDTDWKFPFGLPERFDRLVMFGSLGECFTQQPISFRCELHAVFE